MAPCPRGRPIAKFKQASACSILCTEEFTVAAAQRNACQFLSDNRSVFRELAQVFDGANTG